MKKLIFLFSFILPFIFCSQVSAQSSPAEYYQDFLGKYRIYQAQIEPYQTAKTRHQSYQSVATRAQYLDAGKNLIKAEISSMISFADLVRARLVEATSILNYQENLYFIKLDDEIAFLKLTQNNVDGISSLEELQTFWTDLEKHYKSVSMYANLSRSQILTGSFNKVFENIKITKVKINQHLIDSKLSNTEIKAAKDKFSVTEKDFNGILTMLNSAKTIQNSHKEGDFKNSALEIKNLIISAVAKTEKLVGDYKNIISTVDYK